MYSTAAVPLGSAQRHLSDQMSSYWARFAAAGNPNGLGTPHWRPFRAADRTVPTLDLARVANEYGFGARHRCDFWATVGAGTRS